MSKQALKPSTTLNLYQDTQPNSTFAREGQRYKKTIQDSRDYQLDPFSSFGKLKPLPQKQKNRPFTAKYRETKIIPKEKRIDKSRSRSARRKHHDLIHHKIELDGDEVAKTEKKREETKKELKSLLN